ncbi:MAG: hypothetical protein WBP22_01060 [Candidatus Saccharimonas sp.]
MGGLGLSVMRSDSRRAILHVPGILLPGVIQAQPFTQLAAEQGSALIAASYSGATFDVQKCVDDIAHDLDLVGRLYRGDLTVIMTSLGGMLTTLALKQLGHLPDDVGRFIISDAPSRGRDLRVGVLPDWMNPLIGKLSRVLHPGERANRGYGKWLLSAMAMPPKYDAIELPPGLPKSEHDRYRRELQHLTRQNLASTPFTLWYQQVQWMLNCEQLPLELWQRFTDTVYLANTWGNVTVRQAAAGVSWMPYVRQFETVRAAHCGYDEAWWQTYYPMFRRHITRPLGSLA